MTLTISLLLSYLIGSFPTAYLAGRYGKGIDIRQHGSGNMGTMNTKAVLGWRWAVIVFLVDLLKGVLAVCLSRWAAADPLLLTSATAAGHCYPVWLRFRGGKALATALGAMIAIDDVWSIAIFAAGWVLMLVYYKSKSFLSRQGSNITQPNPDLFSDRANLLGITTLMIFAFLSGPDWWLVLLTAIIMSRLLQSLSTEHNKQ